MTTATAQMYRMDVRRRRSDALTAAIVNEVQHLVTDKREFHDRLRRLFDQQGVEILTDATRAEIGLPPRTSDGWTADEIKALEHHRLNILAGPTLMKLEAAK